MKKTGITVSALILLVSFQLIDAIAAQNRTQVRSILAIIVVLLGLYGATIVFDRWKRKNARRKDENS